MELLLANREEKKELYQWMAQEYLSRTWGEWSDFSQAGKKLTRYKALTPLSLKQLFIYFCRGKI